MSSYVHKPKAPKKAHAPKKPHVRRSRSTGQVIQARTYQVHERASQYEKVMGGRL